MPDFLSIALTGNTAVAARLKALPPAMQDAGAESAAQYVAQIMNRYAANAPYNYVPFAAVGGFYSDRQRRFVMAGLADGSIQFPFSRDTGDHYQKTGTGRGSKVVSNKTSMFYSMSDQGRARLQELRGWGTVGDVLKANNSGIVKAFELGVRDAITNMNRAYSEQMANVAP